MSTSRGARIHLALDGHTGCGARNRASIAYDSARPDLAQPKVLCKRCFTPNRVGAAQRMLTSATGATAERHRIALAGVVDGMKTPAQRATDVDLAARIRADLIASGVLTPVGADEPAALPTVERPRSWADLRREYAKTHTQPQAA